MATITLYLDDDAEMTFKNVTQITIEERSLRFEGLLSTGVTPEKKWSFPLSSVKIMDINGRVMIKNHDP